AMPLSHTLSILALSLFLATPNPAPRPDDPEPIHIFRGSAGVHGAALSPDGKLVAIGGRDGVLELWDSNSGVVKKKLAGHTGTVHDVSFTPDGRQLLSVSGL